MITDHGPDSLLVRTTLVPQNLDRSNPLSSGSMIQVKPAACATGQPAFFVLHGRHDFFTTTNAESDFSFAYEPVPQSRTAGFGAGEQLNATTLRVPTTTRSAFVALLCTAVRFGVRT
jgi:hypothetical protein